MRFGEDALPCAQGPGRWEQMGLAYFVRKGMVAAILPDRRGQFALDVQGIGSDELALQDQQPFPQTIRAGAQVLFSAP
ncbi:MAG TPA: hypothetical protein PK202_11145, partial [Verrucomicrobiota bacterium]|nr:hypothetical protein [Verrucomicrobiota bacterium]